MMRILLRALLVATLTLRAGTASAANAVSTEPPGALRGVDPRTLSSGLLLALTESGYYGGLVQKKIARADIDVPAKGTPTPVLDARVGPNVPLSPDPAALLSYQRAQAEPHVWRSAANPEFLVATFQEGRYAVGGGALGCGYAISRDGGVSWTRALIPWLTPASGGSYVRATDPVAAVDLEGNIYLGTLGARQASFSDGGVVLTSRSTDGGLTFDAPVIVAAGSASHALDKNWLAVNDYAGTPNVNRLAVTYTDIAGNNSYDLVASISDDRGLSWSFPTLIRPHNTLINQATQPFYLPDGSLIVCYIAAYNGSTFRIECIRSADGGRTFPGGASIVVPSVSLWNDGVVRSGSFLITAWVARQSGDVFVTYAGRDSSQFPRIFVTKSSNSGLSWSTPVAVSESRGFISVFNPAVAATPDGQTVTVTYYDKRNAPDATYYVDLYSNSSFDGGVSWQPSIRLTEYLSDVRSAPLTASGYMIGDYQGLVPPFNSNQPAVAVTVDTRSGDPDPLAIRYALNISPGFDAWQAARFSGTEMADPNKVGITADPDGDGLCNAAEFFHQRNPRQPDYGSLFSASGQLDLSYTFRYNFPRALHRRWEFSPDGVSWNPISFENTPTLPALAYNNTGIDLFTTISVPPGGYLLREVFATDDTFNTKSPAEVLAFRTDSRLVNLSTRAQVKSGDSVLIVGFVTAGGAKTMLIRGVGPTLATLGVASPLADPQLSLGASGTPVFAGQQNDSWASAPGVSSALFARLGAFALPPGSLDATLAPSLEARPYTAILSGAGGGTGIGIVEAYDADAMPGAPTGPRLVNLSSRGEVGTGDNILIGGFVISGTQPRRLLLRAVGPGLASAGLGASALSDPVLTLFRRNNNTTDFVASNDDWLLAPNADALASAATHTGAFALVAGSLDSALLLTLAPGIYTAQVSGLNGLTGLALVEIYDAD